MAHETFLMFMKRVDIFLQDRIGLTHSDLPDALWHDVYEDCVENKVDETEFQLIVAETICEADDMWTMDVFL